MEETKSENCGPGCDCGKPSANNKLKAVVCIVVLLSIGSIFAYKTTNGKQTAPVNTEIGFVAPTAEQEPAIPVQEKPAANPVLENHITEPPVKGVDEQKKACEYLDSLAALNKVAANQDVVFVFIPAQGSDLATKETTDAITSAQKKIEATGAKLGLYTLQSSSPEYANIAAQLPLPGMLVMTKGRGIGAVPAGITEEKILQAFVASSRAGGCGPSGCGPVGCN